jgi:hypothetical protein
MNIAYLKTFVRILWSLLRTRTYSKLYLFKSINVYSNNRYGRL